jgi:hypothetical protein
VEVDGPDAARPSASPMPSQAMESLWQAHKTQHRSTSRAQERDCRERDAEASACQVRELDAVALRDAECSLRRRTSGSWRRDHSAAEIDIALASHEAERVQRAVRTANLCSSTVLQRHQQRAICVARAAIDEA